MKYILLILSMISIIHGLNNENYFFILGGILFIILAKIEVIEDKINIKGKLTFFIFLF